MRGFAPTCGRQGVTGFVDEEHPPEAQADNTEFSLAFFGWNTYLVSAY